MVSQGSVRTIAAANSKSSVRKTLSDFCRFGYLLNEMQPKSDAQLLRDYADRGAEAAFTELAHRHTNLVYSAALRQVESPDIAAEIAQNVFVSLARGAKALVPRLAPEASLAGWLCRSARNLSLNHRRDEFRRLTRERHAMEQLVSLPDDAPDWDQLRRVLDDAMSELNEADYDALVLRFFQNQDFRSVGAAIGVSDDTAQKRVTRALEKLRQLLTQRGIRTTAATLAVAISANAVQAAPAGLAITISSAALAGAVVSTATVVATTTKAIAMTTIQKAIIGTTLAIVTGAAVYETQRAAHWRSESERLKIQQAQLSAERDAAISAATAKDNELKRIEKDNVELLRLRGEVGRLRGQTQELEKLRAENRQLQSLANKASQPSQATDENSDPQRQVAYAKMNDSKVLALGLILYANAHQDQLPTELGQTSNYLAGTEHRITGTNQFELVAHGPLAGITNPSATIVLREKEPFFANGGWCKAYAFADGHSEIKREPAEGFEAWEKQHMPPAKSAGH